MFRACCLGVKNRLFLEFYCVASFVGSLASVVCSAGAAAAVVVGVISIFGGVCFVVWNKSGGGYGVSSSVDVMYNAVNICWYTPYSILGILVSGSISSSFSMSASLPVSVAVPSMPYLAMFGFVPTVKRKITVTWPVFLSFSSSLAPTSNVNAVVGWFSFSLAAVMLLIAT